MTAVVSINNGRNALLGLYDERIVIVNYIILCLKRYYKTKLTAPAYSRVFVTPISAFLLNVYRPCDILE